MAASVIDSLVVTLGLDSKAFAQGIKGSTEELASFTKRLAGMFLAVRGLEDVVGYFKDLHAQLAEIGFTSRNLGVAGTELKRLGEVSELFGGQMEDAAASLEGLQGAIFNLKYKGQISEQLLMLQRFGVAYLDAAGHARKFHDIARDAAKVIDRRKAAGADQGELTQLAQSMGFQGGIASAIAHGSAEFERRFKEATKDQKPLTERTIQGQVKLDQDITRLQEATAAQSSAMLSTLTPAIAAMTEELRKLANTVIPELTRWLKETINFFKNPPEWLRQVEGVMKELGQMLGPGGTLLVALAALTTAVGAGGALVSGIASLGALLAPLALAIAGGVGLGSLLDKIPGVRNAIESAASHVYDALGVGSKAGAAATARVPVHGVIARPPATPGVSRPPLPGSSTSTSTSSSTNSTQVHIDEININTRATDANGIAGSIDGALQRKLLVSNADQGQG